MNITTDTEERRRDRGSLRLSPGVFLFGGRRPAASGAGLFQHTTARRAPLSARTGTLLIGVFTPVAPLRTNYGAARGLFRATDEPLGEFRGPRLYSLQRGGRPGRKVGQSPWRLLSPAARFTRYTGPERVALRKFLRKEAPPGRVVYVYFTRRTTVNKSTQSSMFQRLSCTDGAALIAAVCDIYDLWMSEKRTHALRPGAERWSSSRFFRPTMIDAVMTRWCELTSLESDSFPFHDEFVAATWIMYRKEDKAKKAAVRRECAKRFPS